MSPPTLKIPLHDLSVHFKNVPSDIFRIMSKWCSVLLVIMIVDRRARADLPVHCEMKSVVGEWTFWTSHANDYTMVPKLPLSMDGSKFCLGHTGKPTMSSDLMTNAQGPPDATRGFETSFKVGLALTQRVHDQGSSADYDRHELLALAGSVTGKWSMVFDEGFEVRIGNRNYLAISRYTCSAGTPDAWCRSNEDAHENTDGTVTNWDSKCDETFVGWYHETDDSGAITGLGCWFGKRTPGPAPDYLLKPLSVSFAQEKRLRKHQALGTESVKNSCDIDEGIENIVNLGDLPTNFNWREQYPSFNWDTAITVQGECGSCYSVAAVYALQARANLLLAKEGIHEPLTLSTQSVVSCSWYNQGCDGGLEVLVHRHAMEAGIPSQECMDYTSGKSGKAGECNAACFQDESDLVFAKDYGYVGGFNGQCSEARLLRNLYEHGPLTIAVNVANARVGSLDGLPAAQATGRGDSDTIAVKLTGNAMSTVLHELSSHPAIFPYLSESPAEANSADTVGYLFVRASIVNKDLSKLSSALSAALRSRNRIGVQMTDAFTLGIHGWEYIDHSIVVVGYGVKPDGSKFWSIRNSWGGYSEYGAFTNLDRGEDLGAIESGAVWVQPDPCRGKLREILQRHGKLSTYCQ